MRHYHKKVKEERKLNGSDPNRVYRKEQIEDIIKYRHFPNSLADKEGFESLEKPHLKK